MLFSSEAFAVSEGSRGNAVIDFIKAESFFHIILVASSMIEVAFIAINHIPAIVCSADEFYGFIMYGA